MGVVNNDTFSQDIPDIEDQQFDQNEGDDLVAEAFDDFGDSFLEEEPNQAVYFEVPDQVPTTDPEQPSEQSEQSEQQEPQEIVFDNEIDNYVAKIIGTKDGKFITGSSEDPIEYSVEELSPRQKIAIIEDFVRKNRPTNDLSTDEQHVINALRNNDLESVYQDLAVELGRNEEAAALPAHIGGEDLIRWSIENAYPGLSKEQMDTEVEIFKTTGNYATKLLQAKQRYQEHRKNTIEQAIRQQQEVLTMRNKDYAQEVTELASQVDQLADFDVDDDLRNDALGLLIERDGNNLNEIQSKMKSKEGALEVAMSLAALPRLSKMFGQVYAELTELKAQQNKRNFVSSRREDKRPEKKEDTNLFLDPAELFPS